MENIDEQTSEEFTCVIVADIHLSDKGTTIVNSVVTGSGACENHDITDEEGLVYLSEAGLKTRSKSEA